MLFENHPNKKTTTVSKPKSEIKLIPILKADRLLPRLRDQAWLKQIDNELNLPSEHFEILYFNLLESFAEFVQVFPSSSEGKLGGLLSEGISRAILGLKRLKQDEPETFEQNPRYCYAIFSAALLVNIGSIFYTKPIISDKEGRFVAEWRPYSETLVGKGAYYKLRRSSQIPAYLHHHAAIILAKQLIPEVGFKWLAEDLDLFHHWLALLNGDQKNAGWLQFLLAFTREELEKVLDITGMINVEHLELLEAPETQEAENFLLWLQEEIENGNIPINTNEKDIVVNPGGAFVSMELFRQFANAFSADVHTLIENFNALGLTREFGRDFRTLLYSKEAKTFQEQGSFLNTSNLQSNQESPKEGVVIKEAGLLFKSKPELANFGNVSAPPVQPPKLDSPAGLRMTQVG